MKFEIYKGYTIRLQRYTIRKFEFVKRLDSECLNKISALYKTFILMQLFRD